VTTARVQYVLHAALDQTRALRVHVVNVQVSLVRENAAARLHAQVFYSAAGDGYHRRDHDVQPATPFGPQPYPVARVRKLVRRVDHHLVGAAAPKLEFLGGANITKQRTPPPQP